MTNEERDKLINSVLPDTVKGQQRPAENLNPDMPYSTDFPQLINKDPASADVFNLINRQLLSNDKYIDDSKADKTYVDKKVADLVNGAPEQLDTLQELSKALNNDKDYAVTVNNALAEKLGKTEKAESAEVADYAKAADSANSLEGYPLSHGGDSVFGKVPLVGTDGVLEIGRYIDFHSENGDGKDYSTRIESLGNGMMSVSDGMIVGNDISIQGTIISRSVNKSYLQIMGGTTYNTGAHLNLSANNDTMYGSGSFALVAALLGKPQKTLIGKLDGSLIWNGTDLAGAGIVSQQLGLNGYTKYADGRLKMWGCVYVDRNDASVSSTENPGFKFHENYKTVTFPVTVKEIHNVVAVPNALHGVYYESCCIRVKNNSSLNVILIGLQRLADDIMGVDNKVWYLLHGTWK